MSIHPLQSTESEAVGADLEQVRTALLRTCDRLDEDAGDALKQRIAPIRDRLSQYIANISVVGQVKAGKSSLVNCLTRRTGLMPADINPWTSVVSKLYFGHPSGKTSGGRFWFFDDAHWTRLATRGGRLGELTEGLLEDYKRDQLFDEVQAMRERARLRLGDKFEALLGKSQRFETITTEVMERYVCAGDAPKERLKNPEAGRYSDITHTAEIYFDAHPFGCPICVMDTPGTNDPLLIREEITQQNLENADFFIVVLSAHQALSESDLRLLRIMKALKRDQLVVFVNRIDEVDNLIGVHEDLQALMTSRLRKTIGVDVPVVLGSAAWAHYALTGDDADDEIDHDLIARFAQSRPEISQPLDAGQLDLSPDRQAALAASGLPQLERALSTVLYNGAAANVFRGAIDDLLVLLGQSIDRVNFQLQALKEPEKRRAAPLSPGQRTAILKDFESSVSAVKETLLEINDTAWDTLRTAFKDEIDRFVETSFDQSHKKRGGAASAKLISESVDALRDDLKGTYLLGFEAIQDKIWLALRGLNLDCDVDMEASVRARIKNLRIGTIGFLSIEPKADPLYRPVTLDVATGWLSTLLTRSDTRAKAVIETARDQFTEICDQIIAEGKSSFESYTKSSLSNYLFDLSRLLDQLSGQDQAVSIKQIDAGREAGQRIAETQEQLDRLTRNVEKLTALESLFATGRRVENG